MFKDICNNKINNGDWLWNPKDECLIFILEDSKDKLCKNATLVSRELFGYFWYPIKSVTNLYLAHSYKLPNKRFLKDENQLDKIKDAYINILCTNAYHYYCFKNNITKLPFNLIN